MRVLGIDPGSLHTGYGVVEEDKAFMRLVSAGCITNKTKDTIDIRFRNIYSGLREIIRRTRPDIAVLENVIFCNNTKIAIKLGEARGAAILTIVNEGLSITEYAPKKIKQAVVGLGSASKQQVQEMVRRILSMEETPPPDTADALAAAICHIHNDNISKRNLDGNKPHKYNHRGKRHRI